MRACEQITKLRDLSATPVHPVVKGKRACELTIHLLPTVVKTLRSVVHYFQSIRSPSSPETASLSSWLLNASLRARAYPHIKPNFSTSYKPQATSYQPST